MNKAASSVDFGGTYKVTGLAPPTAATDGVTKLYVSEDHREVKVTDSSGYGASYLSIPSLTLTTKDFGENASYLLRTNVILNSTSLTNVSSQLRFTVNGVSGTTTQLFTQQGTTGVSISFPLSLEELWVTNGEVVIAVQLVTTAAAGTLSVVSATLTIEGIRQTRLL